jgi:two-component system sensor kinase FixL
METREIERLSQEAEELRQALAKKDQQLEDMKASNLFLETLFDGISEQIMVVDEDFTIADVNKGFLDNYGLKKEAVIGKKCHKFMRQSNSPCKSANQICPLEEAKRTGKRVEVTHQYKQAGGEMKEVFRIMYPVVTGGKAPRLFAEISRDVTEYRDLIRKVQASENKFKAILDTASEAIISLDEDLKVVLFNNAARRMFGYSGHEVLGKDLSILIPSQYGDDYSYVMGFLETGEPTDTGKNLSLSALRKSGEEFPIEIGLSRYEMEGRPTFTATIRDVSTQKQLEKKLLQSERLAAVGETVAHVVHEIRNPLMIIGGFSHQIRAKLTDEKDIQKVDMTLDEVGRLEKLVADLGDFTKVYNLVKRPADINSVIKDVLKIMAEIYSPDKYCFETDLSPDLQEISCDPDKLKQVFINIIANGIEAMEDGGKIRISTSGLHDGVEIRVTDRGSGISEKDLLRIFEPFYTTRVTGSGLGLSISYKVVEAHKGEIWADSMPGKGTTFFVWLPAR